METKLLRMPAVKALVGFRKTHIYTLIREGKFPPPVRIGRHAVAWDSRAVSAWIQARLDSGAPR